MAKTIGSGSFEVSVKNASEEVVYKFETRSERDQFFNDNSSIYARMGFVVRKR